MKETRVKCWDATTVIVTDEIPNRAVLRIERGNGWTWLDRAAQIEVATALLPADLTVVPISRLERAERVVEAAREHVNLPESAPFDEAVGAWAELRAAFTAYDALQPPSHDPGSEGEG